MARATGYLRRLTLFGKQDIVMTGKISPGHFGFQESEDEVVDLGPSVDLLPIARRAKALDMNGKKPIEVYDPSSEAWKDIQHRADTVKQSKCMYGVSILCIERTTGDFCEWFAGSTTTRRDVGKFYPHLPTPGTEDADPKPPTPVTMKSKYIKGEEFSWYGPVTTSCSTPFTTLPSADVIIDQVNRFYNPKVAKTEVADDTADEADDR